MIGALRRRYGADIACEQAVALATDYLEGALSPRDRARFERHLAGCPHCTEYLAQMRATIGLARRAAQRQAHAADARALLRALPALARRRRALSDPGPAGRRSRLRTPSSAEW